MGIVLGAPQIVSLRGSELKTRSFISITVLYFLHEPTACVDLSRYLCSYILVRVLSKPPRIRSQISGFLFARQCTLEFRKSPEREEW